jgi:hypothetical protein
VDSRASWEVTAIGQEPFRNEDWRKSTQTYESLPELSS